MPELDGCESIWQLNWVQVSEPSQGQTIKNQYNTLWIQFTLRDDTGTIMFYITESAVVKLANVVDAAEFEQHHTEGRLRMPFFASIKVYHRLSKPSAVQLLGIHSKPAQSTQSENDFDCFIVDAAGQDLNEIPFVRPTRLLELSLR